jgi:hypothetical protein
VTSYPGRQARNTRLQTDNLHGALADGASLFPVAGIVITRHVEARLFALVGLANGYRRTATSAQHLAFDGSRCGSSFAIASSCGHRLGDMPNAAFLLKR